MFEGNSLWHLIIQSDAISKFVLFILLVMSIICWTVFFGKITLGFIKKRDMKAALKKLTVTATFEDMVALANNNTYNLPGYFLSHNLRFFKTIAQDKQKLFYDASDMERIQYHIDQTVDTLVYQQEAQLSVLTTSAAIAPLLGLFGTVWGLIHAFIGIAQSQVADISTVAPGIAEALITTLAGLLVAIPAMAMANYLIVQVRTIEQQLTQLADLMTMLMQPLLIKKGKNVCADLPAGVQHEFQQ